MSQSPASRFTMLSDGELMVLRSALRQSDNSESPIGQRLKDEMHNEYLFRDIGLYERRKQNQ